jgi:hypothetical protein
MAETIVEFLPHHRQGRSALPTCSRDHRAPPDRPREARRGLLGTGTADQMNPGSSERDLGPPSAPFTDRIRWDQAGAGLGLPRSCRLSRKGDF